MSTSVQEHVDAPAPQPPLTARRRRWLAAIIVVAVLAAGGTWFVLARHRTSAIAAANVLDPRGSLSGVSFVDARDEAAMRSVADDFQEYSRTVPLRKGEPMAVVMIVTNESDFPVTVLGSTDPERLVVTTATAPEDARGGASDWRTLTFAADVTIHPGRWHYLRAEWTTAETCVGIGQGIGLTLGEFSVNTLVDDTPRVVEVSTSPIIRAVSTSDEEPAECSAQR